MSATWSARHTFPSISQAAHPVVRDLLEMLRAEHWTDHEIFSVHLALEEALSNAMEHGNRWDANKEVAMTLDFSPDFLRIEIVDQGTGFNPDTVPDPRDDDRIEVPRGRGLLIMRAYMSNVYYLENGRRLVLEKHREQAAHVA